METKHTVLKSTPNSQNGVVVSLSVLLVLMFIVICCMSYYIYRLKRNRYHETKILTPELVPTQTDYIRQISNEVPETVSMQKICNFDSPFKQTGILTMVDTVNKDDTKMGNSKSPSPKPVKNEYKKPVTGTKLTMQPIITPDQMNKVCVEVLSKMKRNQSTSLTHLNELMNSKYNGDSTNGDGSKFEDDFEEYDVVPKPRSFVHHEMDVYDSPQIVQGSNNSIDTEGYYGNLPIREDVYQNARLIHDMK